MKYYLYAFLLFIAFNANAQHEEFKQNITSFVAEMDSVFEKKDLNISEQDIGAINDQEHDWSKSFMLKSKIKELNNIGNKGYAKYYFSFYTYPDVTERDYAMKYWLADFIEGEAIRPGRDMRTYPEGKPTIVIINETSIAVLTYACKWNDEEGDAFKAWRKTMLTWFGSPASVVIEVGCNGPLDWSKNPPDAKDRTWR